MVPRAGFLVALSALLTACSSGLVGSPKTDPGEVDRLKQQVVELKQRATVAELEGDRLRREIARLETELKQTRRETSREPPSVKAEDEPAAPATIDLGQEIEETDLEEPPTAPPVVAEPLTVPPAITEPATTPMPPAATAPPAAAEPAVEAATADPSPEAQALYDEGYALFNQKRYADAEARFDRYVKLHPRTNLADNALFWIGECRYARGDFSSALEAFSSTVERYPLSNKVADALFKAGKSLESLGDPQQARRTYQEVVDRFPGTAAAARAGDRIDDLP